MKLIKHKKGFLFFFCSLPVLFFLFSIAVNRYTGKISAAEKKLSSYEINIFNTGCIIKTFGRGNSTVSASISFYTPSEKPIGSYERAWHGSELNLECIVFTFKHGSIVFPYRLFSDKPESTGVLLFNMYSEKDYPAIYDYPFLPEEEKMSIKTLFKSAVFSPYLLTLFSSARLQTVTLASFKPDAEYSLNILPSGQAVLEKL